MILALGKNGQLSKEFQKINTDEVTYLSSNDLDLRDLDKIHISLSKHQPNIILNFTAYNLVDQAENNEDNFLINALAVKKIAEYCKLADIVFIHISTDYVFDGKNKSYIETDLTNPINAYGKAKLNGEKFIQEICSKYFILRTSWLYSLHGNNFLTKIINLYKTEKNFKGADDLIGSPTSARSLAHALQHLIQDDTQKYGLYHFSNTGEISKYQFLQSILMHLAFQNNDPDVEIIKVKNEDFKMTAKRPYNTSLKSDKFASQFNYLIPKWDDELKSIMDKI